MEHLSRRAVTFGGLSLLPACTGLGALGGGGAALPTYDLSPATGARGRRRALSLVVARPEAPAALATDRILVKPDGLTIAYLPDARWSDEAPALVRSLIIRAIAGTGRLAHVGSAEGGPVPDLALLVRIDRFEAEPLDAGDGMRVRAALAGTLIRDRDQRLLSARDFAGEALSMSDRPKDVVAAFQTVMDDLLPALADWAAGPASR